jgi:hypothetical protein
MKYEPMLEVSARGTLEVVKVLLEHEVATKAILAVIAVLEEPITMTEAPTLDFSSVKATT